MNCGKSRGAKQAGWENGGNFRGGLLTKLKWPVSSTVEFCWMTEPAGCRLFRFVPSPARTGVARTTCPEHSPGIGAAVTVVGVVGAKCTVEQPAQCVFLISCNNAEFREVKTARSIRKFPNSLVDILSFFCKMELIFRGVT